MSLPKRIVIVEDEAITQRFLQDIFSQHETAIAGCFDNAKDVLDHIATLGCDMILMDINIKGPMDGIQLARKILEKHAIPIIFITAHNDDETVEETLELSPYGFICKPFTGRDVLVTTQIAYKRYLSHMKALEKQQENKRAEEVVINQKYWYALHESELYCDGHIVELTKNQAMLIEILAKNYGVTVDYDTLISAIWGDGYVADSALRTLVYSVRKLLPEMPITSHSKVGYALEAK